MEEFPQNNLPDENKPEEVSPDLYEDEKTIKPIISPILAAFIGLVGGFIFYQIIGGTLTYIIFGADFKNADINAIRLMQSAGQILFLLVPAIIFTKMFYTNVSKAIRLNKVNFFEIILFSVGSLLLTPMLQSYLAIQEFLVVKAAKKFAFLNEIKKLLDELEIKITETYEIFLKVDSPLEIIFVVFVIAVTPAFCEEFLFRGYIQRSFEGKFSRFSAALITAIFFGLFHFHPYAIVPLTLLGFYFGYAAYKSNSILIPVILHFINNFIAVIIYQLFGSEDFIKSETVQSGDMSTVLIVFVSFAFLFSLLIFGINYYYEKKENTIVL